MIKKPVLLSLNEKAPWGLSVGDPLVFGLNFSKLLPNWKKNGK